MTVESEIYREQYITNGATGPWTVPFYFLANDDLQVIYTDSAGTETTLALGADYSVTGAGDPSGGTVTTTTAYAATTPSSYVTILRAVRLVQETDYTETDAFPAASHERALDRLTMIAQQQAEVVGRALVFAPSDVTATALPAAAARASKLLGFDSSGALLVSAPVSGSAADLAISLAASSGSSGVGFIQSGAFAVARTLQDKVRERLSMEDLGCVGDGVADDGGRLTAALYARYSGLAVTQLAQAVEIHGTLGKNYKFATPCTVRQQNLRFIGNGAKITCTGAYAFDFTQDSSPNWPQLCWVKDWYITGATTAGIRGRAYNHGRIEDNYIVSCAIGIDINGIGVKIRDNYLDANTGDGILVQSATVFGGVVGEAQGCAITGNKVYNSGGWGIHLIEGGGHGLSARNDLEANDGGEIWLQSSFGCTLVDQYIEPDGAAVRTLIKIDNTPSLLGGVRTSEGNQIIGATFGGSAVGSWDLDIQGGNNNLAMGMRPGNGTIRINASCNNTRLLPMAGVFTVTNSSSSTQDLSSISGFWTGVKPSSSTTVPLRNIGGFVDFGAADTSKTVTLATNEDDGAYRVNLTAATNSGAPTAASKRVSLSGLPSVTGFTIVNEGAPGVGTSVRVYYELMR